MGIINKIKKKVKKVKKSYDWKTKQISISR